MDTIHCTCTLCVCTCIHVSSPGWYTGGWWYICDRWKLENSCRTYKIATTVLNRHEFYTTIQWSNASESIFWRKRQGYIPYNSKYSRLTNSVIELLFWNRQISVIVNVLESTVCTYWIFVSNIFVICCPSQKSRSLLLTMDIWSYTVTHRFINFGSNLYDYNMITNGIQGCI